MPIEGEIRILRVQMMEIPDYGPMTYKDVWQQYLNGEWRNIPTVLHLVHPRIEDSC